MSGCFFHKTLTAEQIELYDFEGNGDVAISNALEVLKWLAGLESVLDD